MKEDMQKEIKHQGVFFQYSKQSFKIEFSMATESVAQCKKRPVGQNCEPRVDKILPACSKKDMVKSKSNVDFVCV